MDPEFYSSLFLFVISAFAAGVALRRRTESDSRASYTWVFLAAVAVGLDMACSVVSLSQLTPASLQPLLDTARFWASAAFVYFIYSWTLTVEPWRRPTRKWATLAVVVAAATIAVIPSHGNSSVTVPADWHWVNWAGIALHYAALLYITNLFVHVGTQRVRGPRPSWVVLFQEALLWIAMYMMAVFFAARALISIASLLGLQPQAFQQLALILEVYKGMMGVFFLVTLLPPRWLVRFVRKLEYNDNASWEYQYAVQATADLNDGANPVYRHALVTYVTLLAQRCRVPHLSRVDLLQAASLVRTRYPLATPAGELIPREAVQTAPDADDERSNRPPIIVSLDVARLVEAGSRNETIPAKANLKAVILQAADCFVREAYRDGFSAISPEDAERGWAAAQAMVKDKRVLDGLWYLLLDADMIPKGNVTKAGDVD